MGSLNKALQLGRNLARDQIEDSRAGADPSGLTVLKQGLPGQIGHLEVGNHEIKTFAVERRASFRRALGQGDHALVRLENSLHARERGWISIDRQNALDGGHGEVEDSEIVG